MPDINKMYSWAIQTCNAPDVGYSQAYRNQQTVNGITYYDCSSFINYALLAGGFETPGYAPSSNAFTTYTEADVLLSLGFEEIDASGQILPGDIGLSTGHTEMCYQEGVGSAIFMGAHTDTVALADQVSIASYESSFPRLFRYGSGGATGYGVSIYVVSALCGNAWTESSINPGMNQISGTAYGLFQWDGTRKDALLEWLSENGYNTDSPEGQMKYLVEEGDWQGSFGGISSLDEFLSSDSTDIDMLTEAFMTCWERPGVPGLELRVERAHTAYAYIVAHAQDTNITTWYISDELLTEEQTLNNAVLLYRFYSAGGGGGGTPTTKKVSMPIWLMIKYKY